MLKLLAIVGLLVVPSLAVSQTTNRELTRLAVKNDAEIIGACQSVLEAHRTVLMRSRAAMRAKGTQPFKGGFAEMTSQIERSKGAIDRLNELLETKVDLFAYSVDIKTEQLRQWRDLARVSQDAKFAPFLAEFEKQPLEYQAASNVAYTMVPAVNRCSRWYQVQMTRTKV